MALQRYKSQEEVVSKTLSTLDAHNFYHVAHLFMSLSILESLSFYLSSDMQYALFGSMQFFQSLVPTTHT